MKGDAYAAETLEILKELARHLTITIEFADAEKIDTDEPVFRLIIEELHIEIEQPFDHAVRCAKMAVDEELERI